VGTGNCAECHGLCWTLGRTWGTGDRALGIALGAVGCAGNWALVLVAGHGALGAGKALVMGH